MRRFDVNAGQSGLDTYWSSLDITTDSFVGAPNVIINPNLDSGSTGYSISHANIITLVNSGGNNVFRIETIGVGAAIRSTALQDTVAGEQWYFECKIRDTGSYAGIGEFLVTADKFLDGVAQGISNVPGAAVSASTLDSDWTIISGYYTIPVGTNQVRLRLYVEPSIETGGVFEADEFKMTRKDGFYVDDQIDSSPLLFAYNHVADNRPISKGSDHSIALNSDPGLAGITNIDDFAMGMLIQANTSDLWLIKFTVGTDDIGVRINADTSIDLVWIIDEEIMDETDTVSVVRSVVTESLLYTEDVSYLLLARQTNNVSLTLNGQSVNIQGADELLSNIQLGGGTGEVLVDKISFSTTGRTIPVSDYLDLFKSERLDTVPRPDGDSTFNYLLDSYVPEQYILDSSSFSQAEDYFYANVRSLYDIGLWQILKRASFDIEYSTDAGETWILLTNNTKLTGTYLNVLFRHQNEFNEDYWLDIRITSSVGVPMSYYTVGIDGEVYLPAEVGTGYFDADPGDFSWASVMLTPEVGKTIKSVELLCIINNTEEVIFETNIGTVTEVQTAGYTLYVNGEPREFTSLKPNQIYHLVIVFDTAVDWVNFNPDILLSFELVGLGASDVEYTSADAYYIYNTFVGNPIISALEEIVPLEDGVTDSGEPATVLDVQWDR